MIANKRIMVGNNISEQNKRKYASFGGSSNNNQNS